MNKRTLFWITMVISGLIVVIGIALCEMTPGNSVFTKWFRIVGFFTLMIFLVINSGILRWKFSSQHICKQVGNGKNEPPPAYRIERYIRRLWKYEDPVKDEADILELVDMRGRRSQHPDERLRQAIEKWERIKKQPNGVFLEEFLASEFGITNGVLNVSKSKFYTWRRRLKDNAEIERKN